MRHTAHCVVILKPFILKRSNNPLITQDRLFLACRLDSACVCYIAGLGYPAVIILYLHICVYHSCICLGQLTYRLCKLPKCIGQLPYRLYKLPKCIRHNVLGIQQWNPSDMKYYHLCVQSCTMVVDISLSWTEFSMSCTRWDVMKPVIYIIM